MAAYRGRWMERMRLRTTLLLPLLLLSFGVTVPSLLILRTIVQQQVNVDLASDLRHSVNTYRNLAQQRRRLLARETALLADLPSLKALMTGDPVTIADGGVEFWNVSGSDFFALIDRDGRLIVSYNRGAPLATGIVHQRLEGYLDTAEEPVLLSFDGRLYEVSIQPLLFGERNRNSGLGFVALGYAIDERVAREVSDSAAAEVTFTVGGAIVASTLQPDMQAKLAQDSRELLLARDQNLSLQLGSERYLATAVSLGKPTEGKAEPELIVLKSFEQGSRLIRRVNRWVLTLAILALLAGTAILISISHILTRPLQALLEGTRALAAGNFKYSLSEDGVQEIRELSRAFEGMRIELQRSQRELLDSERLATMGRMASSISHDLRHHLSAMYANAEFMSDARLRQTEREELLLDVQSAVQGMTDLLDSLLLFTQTGRALRPALESVTAVAERAAGLVRTHPAAREIGIVVTGPKPLEAWVDSKKLGRAVYNLLLNACQAAHRGKRPASVTLQLQEDALNLHIRVADTGPGVPEALRQTMYIPFVSEGKESGVGLGLTIARQIAQEHGGTLALEEDHDGLTVFMMTLPKAALASLKATAKGPIRDLR